MAPVHRTTEAPRKAAEMAFGEGSSGSSPRLGPQHDIGDKKCANFEWVSFSP